VVQCALTPLEGEPRTGAQSTSVKRRLEVLLGVLARKGQ
jgi:hypothetical protein